MSQGNRTLWKVCGSLNECIILQSGISPKPFFVPIPYSSDPTLKKYKSILSSPYQIVSFVIAVLGSFLWGMLCCTTLRDTNPIKLFLIKACIISLHLQEVSRLYFYAPMNSPPFAMINLVLYGAKVAGFSF